MWVFTTREIVSFIYILLFLIYASAHKTIRSLAIKVINAACTRKLVVPFVLMLLYASVIVIIIINFRFWDWIYLKDIIIWILFAGIPTCFNAVSKTIDEHYFRHLITDNLKFAALVEFFTGTFTFNILIEAIIQPVLLVFLLMQIISETKDQYKAGRSLINWIVAILGFTIFGLTLKTAIDTYNTSDGIQIIMSFCIPLLFSLLYLPIAHGFAVYAKYEMLFIRMSFKEPQDKKIRRNYRWKVILLCKLSYKKICEFTNTYVKDMYVTMKDTEFDNIIHNFKATYR